MLQQKQIKAIYELQREAYSEAIVYEDSAWTYWACTQALALRKLDLKNVITVLRASALVRVQEALEKNNILEVKYLCRAVEKVVDLMYSTECDNE